MEPDRPDRARAPLGGFDLLRRDHTHGGAGAIGLSIALKPLALVLPLVLLARRETRRAGAIAVGYAIAVTILAQGFLARRADSIGLLDPFKILTDFSSASAPGSSRAFTCTSESFSPVSLLCQLVGSGHWALQNIAVWALVALIGLWVIDALPGCRPQLGGVRVRLPDGGDGRSGVLESLPAVCC